MSLASGPEGSPNEAKPIRIALVHDWLTGMRGGEYVLEAIAEMFPRSDLFTLIAIPGKLSPILTTLKRHTSWLQKIPGAEKRYRSFLPLMPRTIESFDLSEFDLIISTSHCVAKGVKKRPDAVHITYIFAPMRYMWDRFDEYFGKGKASLPVRLGAAAFRGGMQRWDREVSQPDRIDAIVTLSHFIAERIQEFYGRKSAVVYPFADLSRFELPRRAGRNYLMVGAFAPYKRVDLAIEVFNELKLPLLIVGGGQDEARLKKMAGPTVEFLGSLSNAAIADLYSKCRAFVFPGVEDFGITPLEAMASGAPVIALKQGGAVETVTSKTGIFFEEQTVEGLRAAVLEMERRHQDFDPLVCREQASHFTKERFQREFYAEIARAWQAAGKSLPLLEIRIQSGWSVLARNGSGGATVLGVRN